MSKWIDLHILTGRAAIRVGGPDLQDDARLWSEIWAKHRARLLPRWISEHPGTRPPAFYAFDDLTDDQHDDESEAEYLSRIGELQASEVEALRIVRKADQCGVSTSRR